MQQPVSHESTTCPGNVSYDQFTLKFTLKITLAVCIRRNHDPMLSGYCAHNARFYHRLFAGLKNLFSPGAVGVGVVLVCLVALLPGGKPAAADKTTFIDIGTGGPTGVYFIIGQAICRLVKKQAVQARKNDRQTNRLSCVAPATGGSVENVRHVAGGEFDFGIAQSDVQYEAYHGVGKFQDAPMTNLRSVMAFHPEPFHLVVSAQSKAESLTDLVGKRVNIGNPSSGQRATMSRLMSLYGIEKDDFSLASQLNSSEQSQALCDGKIDAFVYSVGVPNGGVALATDVCGARIVNLNGPIEKTLIETYPYYAFFSIPAGSYATLLEPAHSFGAQATLVTRAGVPDDIVYELTRTIMDNISSLRQLHPALETLDPAGMIQETARAPLHPGAARYYQERGWLPETESAP